MGQRVGIEDTWTVATEGGRHPGSRFVVKAERRPDQECVDLVSRQHGFKGCRVHRCSLHQGVRASTRMRCQRFRPAEDRREPRAAAQSGTRAEPRRPDAGQSARCNRNRTTGIFMDAGSMVRPVSTPEIRGVAEDRRCDPARNEDGLGPDADIGQGDDAAEAPPGVEQMAGLQPEESDGLVGSDGRAIREPGIAVDPARHIDRDHRSVRRVDAIDQRREFARDRPAEAGPEQGVDHEVMTGRIDSIYCRDRSGPGLRRQRGVALQRGAFAGERQRDPAAALRQQAGCDEAIATIVARAAQHKDALAGADAPRHRVGDRLAGPLHQDDARCAGRDCHRIRGRHLCDTEQSEGGEIDRHRHARIVCRLRRRGKDAGDNPVCTHDRHLHIFWTVFRLFKRRFAPGGVMAAGQRRCYEQHRRGFYWTRRG